MNCITIRFYGELNDFLPLERRQVAFRHCFRGRPAAKDVIESLGVPHPEVDLLLVDGQSVGFAHRLRGGERVSVYPPFRRLEVGELSAVRPAPPEEPRFVLDNHLSKLAGYLRMVGLDARYRKDAGDEEIAATAAAEGRIVLTRDRGLLKRSQVAHGYCVREDDPERQLFEVISRFHLFDRLRPFTRCMRCNGVLEPVAREEVWERLPRQVREFYTEYTRCPACGGVYWRGTHYDRMREKIQRLQAAARGQQPSAAAPGEEGSGPGGRADGGSGSAAEGIWQVVGRAGTGAEGDAGEVGMPEQRGPALGDEGDG